MAARYSSELMVRLASADAMPWRGAGTISPDRVRAQSRASSSRRAHAAS